MITFENYFHSLRHPIALADPYGEGGDRFDFLISKMRTGGKPEPPGGVHSTLRAVSYLAGLKTYLAATAFLQAVLKSSRL